MFRVSVQRHRRFPIRQSAGPAFWSTPNLRSASRDGPTEIWDAVKWPRPSDTGSRPESNYVRLEKLNKERSTVMLFAWSDGLEQRAPRDFGIRSEVRVRQHFQDSSKKTDASNIIGQERVENENYLETAVKGWPALFEVLLFQDSAQATGKPKVLQSQVHNTTVKGSGEKKALNMQSESPPSSEGIFRAESNWHIPPSNLQVIIGDIG